VKGKRLAIIGGGPAGLTLARYLADRDFKNVTVFEKESVVGGKSLSVTADEAVFELGTCYATLAHRDVLGWMREEGITVRRVGESYVGDVTLNKWISRAGSELLFSEVARYLWKRRGLLAELERKRPRQAVLDVLAAPTLDWLRHHRFQKIERLMLRIVTAMGYGLLDEVPLLHTLRWVEAQLVVSGALHLVYMPLEGWSEFWDRLARRFDVRLDAGVVRVDRSGDGCIVHCEDGSQHAFDGVVCAVPLNRFMQLVDSAEYEMTVSNSLSYGRFVTSLSEVDGFDSRKLLFFPSALEKPFRAGQLLSRRYDGEGFKSGLYVLNQLGGDYSEYELKQLLEFDCAKAGGTLQSVIHQKVWEYFPSLSREAIAGGVLTTMKLMQGAHRTWYTGAAFSHEAVSSISRFNRGLASKIVRDFAGS
jgi:predicted NAD/FAD-dependent oxidoreductase